MSRLSEKEIISIFQKNLNNKISEDVEIFTIGKKFGIIKIDTLVQSTDIPKIMSPEQIANKSMVGPLSDFAAKGVIPKHGIISVSLPKKYPKYKLVRLANGFKKASKKFGVKILGGDTNQAKEIIISIMLFGISEKIIPRNGARIGDIIITTGKFGMTGAGLGIILNKNKSSKKFRKDAINSVVLPKPQLQFGVLASRYCSSSMDSSDGLSTTLTEMSRSSKKKFIITKIPIADGLEEFARINHKSVLDLVFNSGEEYEIVLTVSQKNISKIKKIANSCKIQIFEIGYVKSGSGVFLQKNNKKIKITDNGWEHFRN